MRCRRFEQQVCDYLDDALTFEPRRAMDEHRLACAGCAEALEEADFARTLLRRAPAPEPPAEMIADIIHDTIGVGSGPAGGSAGNDAGGLWGWLRPVFHPFQQPRFVMGMAMTALSASMMSFYGNQALERWQAAATTPAAAVEVVGERVGGAWERAVEVYESAKELYKLQVETGPGPAAEPEGDE